MQVSPQGLLVAPQCLQQAMPLVGGDVGALTMGVRVGGGRVAGINVHVGRGVQVNDGAMVGVNVRIRVGVGEGVQDNSMVGNMVASNGVADNGVADNGVADNGVADNGV
jgi:hypothetical protein